MCKYNIWYVVTNHCILSLNYHVCVYAGLQSMSTPTTRSGRGQRGRKRPRKTAEWRYLTDNNSGIVCHRGGGYIGMTLNAKLLVAGG